MANELASPPRRASAVIFDMDGLLLDTEGIYTEVIQLIVGRYGHRFDWSVKQHTIGLGARDSANRVIEALALPLSVEAFLVEREALLQTRFPLAKAMPGAEDLVRHLAGHRVPIAVGTSSVRASMELKSQAHRGWFDLFPVVVTADDREVRAAKPAPDIFLAAAKRLGVAPAEIVVFEDSPFGVAAARAAGMSVVAVPDPAMDRQRYRDADALLGSLHEFDPLPWSLPAIPK